jgi:fumarate reductase subunit C
MCLITMLHLWWQQIQEYNFITLQEAMSVFFVFENWLLGDPGTRKFRQFRSKLTFYDFTFI